MEMVLGVPNRRTTWLRSIEKLHRQTNLFPILTVHFRAPLFKPTCLHSTSLPCLLWHNNVWLLPDFQSSPLALWGNGQWWLEAILTQQSGGQGCPSATLSSGVLLWPCLTRLVENNDWHMRIKVHMLDMPTLVLGWLEKTVLWTIIILQRYDWASKPNWQKYPRLLLLVEEDSMMQVWLEENGFL